MLLIGEAPYNSVGTAPRDWERAVGYGGEARYVGFFWTPCGDEAMYDDGCVSADGNWWVYLQVVDNLDRRGSLARHYSLGSSEEQATHYLLLDRKTRNLYIVPRRPAAVFLQAQHPPAPNLSPEELQRVYERAVVLCQEAQQRAHEEPAQGIAPCPSCGMSGWVRAPDGGFDPCPECAGRGLLVGGDGATSTAGRHTRDAEAPA